MTLWKGVIGGAHPLGRWSTHLWYSQNSITSEFAYEQLQNWAGAWWFGDGLVVLGVGNRAAHVVTMDSVVQYTVDEDTGQTTQRLSVPGTPAAGLSDFTCGPAAGCATIELRATIPNRAVGYMHTPPLTGDTYSTGTLNSGDVTLVRDATQYAYTTFHPNLIVPRLFNPRTQDLSSVEFFLVLHKISYLTRRTRKSSYTSIRGSV
jgi:hypothetical protein